MFLNGLSQTAHKNMARAPHRMAKTFRSHVTLRSNVLLPVKKQPPAKSSAISHKLLERAGFIKQSAAGVYTFLPLGLEVLNRIESVVDIEMQKIGAQKVQMPLLLSADLWKTTGRWKSTGRELFRLQDRKNHDFCLGPTHEETVTDLVASLGATSQSQLPIKIYQIGRKYRDEARPRFGLLRCREFVMKDMYTFDSSIDTAMERYAEVCESYKRLFNTLGMEYVKVRADSGNIGGDTTHEFHSLSSIGEDVLMVCSHSGDMDPESRYASNIEVASGSDPTIERIPLEEIVMGPSSSRAANKVQVSQHRFRRIQSDKDEVVLVVHGNQRDVNPVKLSKSLSQSISDQVDFVTQKTVENCSIGDVLHHLESLSTMEHPTRIICDNDLVTDAAATFSDVPLNSRLTKIHLADVSFAKAGDRCIDPNCACKGSGTLATQPGIEIGQAFYLGTKYSETLGATFIGEKQEKIPLEMGCYGLGVTRIMAALIETETGHDEEGIIWPSSVAPVSVVIASASFPKAKQDLKSRMQTLAEQLSREIADTVVPRGFGKVVLDDRWDASLGAKISEARLIGTPVVVILDRDTLETNQPRVLLRHERESKAVEWKDACETVLSFLDR